ncbi:MAG: ABC transporter permease [Acidobacteriota bacterium]
MWRYLFLLREFVRRDFDSRYAGSALGFVWSLVQPAWQLLLFYFVFATVMRIPLIGERTDNFAIFLFCGLLPWLAVHEGVLRSTTAITDNANLVKKIHFPAEILVLTAVLGAVIHQLIASALFVVALAVLGELALEGLPWLALALPMQIALTTGLGLLTATANTFFRDVSQLLGLILTGWFYVTPIVYPLSLPDPSLRPWLELNPLTALVGLYRSAFLGGAPSSSPTGFWSLTILTALALPLGILFFRKLKPRFADEL